MSDIKNKSDVKGKGKETGEVRQFSFTETRFRERNQQIELEQNGPNVLTGSGMEAHNLIARLESHKKRTGFEQRFMDKANSREQLQKELMEMVHRRKKKLNGLLQVDLLQAPSDTGEIDTTRILNVGSGYLKDHIASHVQKAKQFSEISLDKERFSKDMRDKAFRYAAATASLLEKHEWDLTHPQLVEKGAGRLSEEDLAKAKEKLIVAKGVNPMALHAMCYELTQSQAQFRSSIAEGIYSKWANAFIEIEQENWQLVESGTKAAGLLEASLRSKITGENLNRQYSEAEISELSLQFMHHFEGALELEKRAKEMINTINAEASSSSGSHMRDLLYLDPYYKDRHQDNPFRD